MYTVSVTLTCLYMMQSKANTDKACFAEVEKKIHKRLVKDASRYRKPVWPFTWFCCCNHEDLEKRMENKGVSHFHKQKIMNNV